jgi:hypothetical protein
MLHTHWSAEAWSVEFKKKVIRKRDVQFVKVPDNRRAACGCAENLLPRLLPCWGSFMGFSGVFVVRQLRHEKRGEAALSVDFIGGGPNGIRTRV